MPPVPETVELRKQLRRRVLLRSPRKCASRESPLEKSPVGRIQAQCEPNVRRKKEESGKWVLKRKEGVNQPPTLVSSR
jgi:hypothetical protein